MIFVSGYGQMCNNILQFGHLYAWGREHGVNVIAMHFCYKYQYFAICRTKYYNWFTYLFAKYGAKIGLIHVVSFPENEEVDQGKVELIKKSQLVLIKGWSFRDYEAFLTYREEIKKLFAFQSKISQKVEKILPPLTENVIRLGVHIRRGDYKKWMDGNYYYSDEDYIKIILSFCSLFSGDSIEIFIVSNEKDLPQKMYKTGINSTVCFLSGNPAEDLYSLSTCNYIIGPPSTFSLMAAFYNDSNLYWILDKKQTLKKEYFQKFDCLFRNII